MAIRYRSVLLGAALLLAVTGCSPERSDGVIDGSPTPAVRGTTADDAKSSNKGDDLDVVVERDVE